LGSVPIRIRCKRFITEQAAQCGYCMNGMSWREGVCSIKIPITVSDIKQSLNNYICRCGTHLRIIRAIQRQQTRA